MSYSNVLARHFRDCEQRKNLIDCLEIDGSNNCLHQSQLDRFLQFGPALDIERLLLVKVDLDCSLGLYQLNRNTIETFDSPLRSLELIQPSNALLRYFSMVTNLVNLKKLSCSGLSNQNDLIIYLIDNVSSSLENLEIACLSVPEAHEVIPTELVFENLDQLKVLKITGHFSFDHDLLRHTPESLRYLSIHPLSSKDAFFDKISATEWSNYLQGSRTRYLESLTLTASPFWSRPVKQALQGVARRQKIDLRLQDIKVSSRSFSKRRIPKAKR
jgi:hypothetical protein